MVINAINASKAINANYVSNAAPVTPYASNANYANNYQRAFCEPMQVIPHQLQNARKW